MGNQVLSSVTVPVITNAECLAIYGFWVRDTNICTSGVGGRGFCAGDSGGPLVVDSNGRKILVRHNSHIYAMHERHHNFLYYKHKDLMGNVDKIAQVKCAISFLFFIIE